jgi:carbonic anhydrase
MDIEPLHGRTPSMADMAHLEHETKAGSGAEAIARLKAGNDRFVSGRAETQVADAFARRGDIVTQTPFAVVLGCSDSRVPVEIVFDQGPGDLFVVRVAGNVAESSALATVEFAIKYLEIRAVVVLGHEGCSAVQLAMGTWLQRQNESRLVRELIEGVVPSLAGLDRHGDERHVIERAVELNVRHQVHRMLAADAIGPLVRAGSLDVVGAYYEIATGLVHFL